MKRAWPSGAAKEPEGIRTMEKTFFARVKKDGLTDTPVRVVAESLWEARAKLEAEHGEGSLHFLVEKDGVAERSNDPDRKSYERVGRVARDQIMGGEVSDQTCTVCGGRITECINSLPYWFSVACPCGRCTSYYKDI